jgi:hypothetical protein
MVFVKQHNLNLIYEVIQQMRTFLFTDLEKKTRLKIIFVNYLKEKWSFQSLDRIGVRKTSANG